MKTEKKNCTFRANNIAPWHRERDRDRDGDRERERERQAGLANIKRPIQK